MNSSLSIVTTGYKTGGHGGPRVHRAPGSPRALARTVAPPPAPRSPDRCTPLPSPRSVRSGRDRPKTWRSETTPVPFALESRRWSHVARPKATRPSSPAHDQAHGTYPLACYSPLSGLYGRGVGCWWGRSTSNKTPATGRAKEPFSVRLSIHLSRHTFLIIGGHGLHASWRGREIAWTRQLGWVRG